MLAIVGLVAGLAFPQMEKALVAMRERHARAQVLAAADGARAQALRSGAMVALQALPDGTGLVAGLAGPWPLDSGMSVATYPAQVRFYADGTTTGGEVQVTGPGGTKVWTIGRDTGALSESDTGAR